MKLYFTDGSPYARIVRVLILEKGLTERVELIPATVRVADSPYYAINPSGRVPWFVRDDGVGMEDSALICAWLDQVDGQPGFRWTEDDSGWEGRRLEALARSMLDGLAVWGRELARPENERSPTILRHEAARCRRLADVWEQGEIDHALMRGPLNLAQLTLACGLGFAARFPALDWRTGHPRLCEWFADISRRPSLAATVPARAHG